MELYIYNPDIELQGVIDVYTSLRWRRRFFEPGEFELHCPANAENLDLLREDNIVHRIDRQEAGIIEGITVDVANDGGDEITVTGRMGSSLLDCRIILPAINFTGTVEAAIRKLVLDNAINNRPLPHLVLGDAANLIPTCTFQATGKNVLTVCKALGKAAPLGIRVRLDVPNRQWVLECYDGVNRSVTQSDLPYVLFSDEFGNIDKPTYAANSTGYKNYAFVAGEGEGADRVVVEVDLANGSPRRELWVDARDLRNTEETSESLSGDGKTASFGLSHVPYRITSVTIGGDPADYTISGSTITFSPAPEEGMSISVEYTYKKVPDDVYAAQLRQRGLEKLAGAVKSESFSAAAVNTGNFAYREDWDLGDIVSFEKWGLRLDQRVTEIEEIYEGGTAKITPVCGSPLPEILDLGSDN